MSSEARLRQKLGKKLKLAAGKTMKLKEGKKKTKRTHDLDDSYEVEIFDERVLKSRVKDKKVSYGGQEKSDGENNGKCKTGPIYSDSKKKGIYCDQYVNGKLSYNTKTPDSKILSKKRQSQVKDVSIKQKNNSEPPRTIWVSKRPSHKVKDTTGSALVSSGKGSNKAKEADKLVDDGNVFSSKYIERKSNSSKRHNRSQSEFPEAFASTSAKTSAWRKKNTADDGIEVLDEQPKKKKRVIRLDPHDISNKRIDDGVVTDESAKEKIKELEKDTGMSKNAQFRAIKPSPSILSYVEDNLLGRRRLIELKRAGYNTELSVPLDNIPFSTSSERERIEENVFRNRLEFFAAAKVSSSFPPPHLPEIAFAGRSNVGKSSLLNSLTRQWGVARTSDKPGLTQTINFFKLGSKMCLVDLPGYGFAYAKEEVKDAWEELVKEYVSTRVGLKQVCLLVDTKWGMKQRDHELVDLMERSQTKYQIVLTKTDLGFPIDVARRAMQIEESLKANKSIIQPVMMVSSKSGAGIRSLRTVLSKIARFAKL